ncbi:MAG: M6 family metalloprotease domain-containing protein [Candidatus Delongbacteria bacterium]|jgi:M6 family metalloprotease-like protein|nr:M6 family metalloprotease domain-containing protein [Candidatus Delongbacteria bacterium]
MKAYVNIIFVSFLVGMLTSMQAKAQSLKNYNKRMVGHCQGIPAYPGIINYTQPDGSIVDLFHFGDALVNWAQTRDGYTALKNQNGWACYAMKNHEGNMVCSDQPAHNPDHRSQSDVIFLRHIKKELRFSPEQVSRIKSQHPLSAKKNHRMPGSLPTTGTQSIPVVLVNYSDTSNVFSAAQMTQPFQQSNYGGTGCIQEYFNEVSFGQLNLQFSFSNWLSLPQTHDYYGIDANYGQFAWDAINAADPSVDFSQYDNDGDGIVEAVSIIHQGSGEEASYDTTDIWSHTWTLEEAGYSQAQRMFDGVEVNTYTVQAEDDAMGNLNQIGIMCHEIGHLLGAPDFYDTDYTAPDYRGTGFWDIQGDGSWNGTPMGSQPAHPNVFTKIYYYNWMEADELNSPVTVNMLPTMQEQQAYYFTTTTSNEYFLIENKMHNGFDAGLPGQGLLIYHVDQDYIDNHFNSNDINATSHLGLKIMDAGNNGNIDDDDCPFPGSSINQNFTDASTPSSLSWLGNPTNKPVTSITSNYSMVSFDFMGGSGCVPPPLQCDSLAATSITDNSISLQWARGLGEKVLVLAKESTDITTEPQSNMPYIANAEFGLGEGPDPETFAVFYGDDDQCTITGLNPGTSYYFSLHEAYMTNDCYRLPGLKGSFMTTGSSKISDHNKSVDFDVYCDNRSETLLLHYTDNLEGAEVEIRDVYGHLLKQCHIKSQISTAGFAHGFYILQLSNKKHYITKTFVK